MVVVVVYLFTYLLTYLLTCLLPYKDVRGSWKISVVFERDSVTIRHRKWEQTHDHDATHFFRFHWQVRLVWRCALHLL